jgi:hypothetical protein
MCGLCGFPAAPGHWAEAGARLPGDRLRARLRRAAVLRRALRAHGLDLRDGAPMPGVRLIRPGGGEHLVPDLAALWRAAERVLGAPLDPLDPRFLGGCRAQGEALRVSRGRSDSE